MLNLKRMVCMLLTAGMFTTALPVQALAASDYQYITNISLKVEVDLAEDDEGSIWIDAVTGFVSKYIENL